ncbi:MAG: pyridoxamine 5'-phosphate oxidase family protein [Parvibaculaceae bacterium]
MRQSGGMPAHYTSLDEIGRHAEHLLSEAVKTPDHPFRKPVLATVDAEGCPRARTVILRHVDFSARTVRIHTDARSAKITEIGGKPDVTLVFYDPREEVQVQLSGKASIHTDDEVAEAAWQTAAPPSRRAYLADPAPGTVSQIPLSGLPADVEGVIPGDERLAEGRPSFAAILVRFHRLDWLFLSPNGNRRARFTLEATGMSGTWLVP